MSTAAVETAKKVKYPGIRVTSDGNTLVANTEGLICEGGVFYPITPSTQMGEIFQNRYAKGLLNAFGMPLTAIETEGEHAAQGGAIAFSVTGRRVVNFTSGQGIVYGLEQYYHAPGKLSTLVVEVGSRALTKHALNVHCGHDDIYATLDTGWTILFARDAQQAVDQALIIRRVNELSLNPGMNVMDGFLTTHIERTFLKPEADLIREFLGAADDIIPTPTESQRILFGNSRRRVPAAIDLKNPVLLGPVQNQEHYMNGVAARRNNFTEEILPFIKQAYREYGKLTGRYYDFVSTYNWENSETVFVVLGSAAENIEAVSDYIKRTRGENLGVLHLNVLRPFPENAIVNALRGKKNVIILERTDEAHSGDNPLARDIKAALQKAEANHFGKRYSGIDKIDPITEKPDIYCGVYGLGSRDFRPEAIIGAYDYALGRESRKDGLKKDDGIRFFFCGIDHPYAVESEETPSCLPNHSIAVRFHSIGGWGMITTGKNLGNILGGLSTYVAKRDEMYEDNGDLKEVVHISANPKYGSEKKGAPTNYFLVAAPERIRVTCDLRHVNVVLCCDPKIFLHANPLNGMEENGAFVWESNGTNPTKIWQRIPIKYREEIIRKKIRVFALSGFEIAKKNTSYSNLQTRMQGNAFLGAFFKVSGFLTQYKIPKEEFLSTVRNQYDNKFGRFGEDVVESNMQVMRDGFNDVFEVPYGKMDDPDISSFMSDIIQPCNLNLSSIPGQESQKETNGSEEKAPLFKMSTFDKEYRSGLGYHQPSSPLASVGVMAAGTGQTASKYVARREVPVFIEENCTQCMDCITVCPDTALPNTAQDLTTILSTAIHHYISDENSKFALLGHLETLDSDIREHMLLKANDKNLPEEEKFSHARFAEIVKDKISDLKDENISDQAVQELYKILDIIPTAYLSARGIFSGKERKEEGSGGIFSIFVADSCKGCAACVEACGSHEALKMVPETEEVHADLQSTQHFLSLLSDTPSKYLGIFDDASPQDSKAAALKFHLMLQSKYNAFVSGDGACAGCGEKSALRSIATLTEMLMRPVFKAKANRLLAKADDLMARGIKQLNELQKQDESSYRIFRRTVFHTMAGCGSEDASVTEKMIEEKFDGNDKAVIDSLVDQLRKDAHNHVKAQMIEGQAANGMSVMAMAAHTGCNTVYGSTPPNNPHPYPWMNSLFQDGATIGWLIGEGFIKDHAFNSVIPERLTDYLLSSEASDFKEADYFRYTHFSDSLMTEDEIAEMPKVWVVGGDGGMGDIGYQNVSKVILQNRPNIKMLMMDTQVYSNTGGQNSDSSPMLGGGDMNAAGDGSEGKMTEMKSVAESFLGGHGSPYVARVSMANVGSLYKSILEGLLYRGTAFFQVYTTCQPEHGVADHLSQVQAHKVRDSRGMPEFVFNPQLGETYQEALNIKGNPSFDKDWCERRISATRERYTYFPAHWAVSEARFRFHRKKVKENDVEGLMPLPEILACVTMDDIIHRNYLNKNHRAYIPNFGVYLVDRGDDGSFQYFILSRQMVIFCIERRKAWRMLQSRAGVVNKDYVKMKELMKKWDGEEISKEEYLVELGVLGPES